MPARKARTTGRVVKARSHPRILANGHHGRPYPVAATSVPGKTHGLVFLELKSIRATSGQPVIATPARFQIYSAPTMEIRGGKH